MVSRGLRLTPFGEGPGKDLLLRPALSVLKLFLPTTLVLALSDISLLLYSPSTLTQKGQKRLLIQEAWRLELRGHGLGV